MTLARMFDASRPPLEPYPGCAAVAGYIGGATPHVWTLAEWQRFGHLRQLPIWVAGLAGVAPHTQALMAVQAATKLGWQPHRHERRAIALDLEATVDPLFVRVFGQTCHDAGFSCWPYGSQAFIFGNPTEDGYWVAAYPGGGPVIDYPGENAVAHQFAAEVPWQGGAVDLSVISAAGLAHLGRGPRRAAW